MAKLLSDITHRHDLAKGGQLLQTMADKEDEDITNLKQAYLRSIEAFLWTLRACLFLAFATPHHALYTLTSHLPQADYPVGPRVSVPRSVPY